jgi:hypothetical protein
VGISLVLTTDALACHHERACARDLQLVFCHSEPQARKLYTQENLSWQSDLSLHSTSGKPAGISNDFMGVSKTSLGATKL